MTETPRTIVITGASSGIGASAAKTLAEQGADVVIVGRHRERTRTLADRIGADFLLADFTDLADVRRLADELTDNYDQIDVVAHNAGLHAPTREVTRDGHEMTLQVNYLAPFLLNSLLMPRLRESAHTHPVRVISTSSAAHRLGDLHLEDLEFEKRAWMAGWPAYCASKLASVFFTGELARREADAGIQAYAFHPGIVASRFGAESRIWQMAQTVSFGHGSISAEAGAEPLVMLAQQDGPDVPNGSYLDRFDAHARVNKQLHDTDLARRLWETTEQILGLTAGATA